MISPWGLAPFLAVPFAGFVLGTTLSEQLDTVENLVIGSTGLVAVAVPAVLLLWKSLNAAQARHVEELQRTIERLQREVDLNRPVYGQAIPPPVRHPDPRPRGQAARMVPDQGAGFATVAGRRKSAVWKPRRLRGVGGVAIVLKTCTGG